MELPRSTNIYCNLMRRADKRIPEGCTCPTNWKDGAEIAPGQCCDWCMEYQMLLEEYWERDEQGP